MALIPYDTSNSFRFDGWVAPEHTVPREESTDLLAAARNGQRLFVDGPRRCGKSTLVINTLEQANIPVLRIDLEGIASAEKLVERISRDARRFIEENPTVRKKLLGSKSVKAGAGTNLFGFLNLSLEAQESTQGQGIERSLDSLLTAIADVAKAARGVVFVDEFQAIKNPNIKNAGELLGSFAAVSDPAHTRGQTSFIFAGSNRAAMHTIFVGDSSSFFQRTQNLPVGPIPQESILPFLNKRMGVPVPDDVGAEAYRWVEGIPGDLQRVYSAIRRHIGDRKGVTMEDLEAAKQNVLRDIGRSYTLTLQTLPELQLKILDAITTLQVRTAEDLAKLADHLGVTEKNVLESVKEILKLGLLHNSVHTGILQRPEPILFHYLEKNPAIKHHPFHALGGVQNPGSRMSDKLEATLSKKKSRQTRCFSR